MRKLSLLLVMTMLVCLCGCTGGSEKQTVQDIIDFDKNVISSVNTEIDVYNNDDIYMFSNKYDRVPEELYNSLNQYEVKKVSETEETDNRIHINFNNPYSELIGISIDDKDQIIFDMDYDNVYKCDGIYDGLQEYFKPVFAESERCYKIGSTPVSYQYEYAIYDKDLHTVKYDLASRQPHITRVSEDIICLWRQDGTGILARWSVYYNRETGEESPMYSGQTDSRGNLTCNAGSDAVTVSDIFSGKELYKIDKFNEPLADYVENIVSAYFTEDGTQIKVVYKNEAGDNCEQVFDLPEEILPQ